MKGLKVLASVLLVIAGGIILLLLRFSHVSLPFLKESVYRHEISYQLLTLGIAGLFVFAAFVLGGREALGYLNLTRLQGEVHPVRWLGITVKEHQNWLHLGSSFLIVLTLVTGAVIYLQVIRPLSFVQWKLFPYLFIILAFALTNSLAEELMFRYSITSVFLTQGYSATAAAVASGLIFGAVHYFGSPGGFPGVVMASFLGWFLSKSIAENHGIFWAWSIHCTLDVVIFYAKYLSV